MLSEATGLLYRGWPGPPNEPKRMAGESNIETIGSIGSIVLGSFGGPGGGLFGLTQGRFRVGPDQIGVGDSFSGRCRAPFKGA